LGIALAAVLLIAASSLFFAIGYKRRKRPIIGNVTDEVSGLPVSGATVSLYNTDAASVLPEKGKLVSRHMTEDDGSYATMNSKPENYMLEISAAGYVSQTHLVSKDDFTGLHKSPVTCDVTLMREDG
jgi:hypothetical protein